MKDLTQGSVLRALLPMAGFMLAAMLVQTLYGLIDLFWVGRLGPQAQAAVTLSGTFMFIAMAFTNALSTGTVALVAQAVGREDGPAGHHIFNQALGLSMVLMLLFGAGGWAGREAFGRLFAADPDTARLSAQFLGWYVPATALQFPIAVASSALRGTGNMRPGTITQIGAVLLNIVLAPLLIFGWLGLPALGVAGAGLATFLATFASLIGLGLYFLHPRTYLRLDISDWLPRLATSWNIVKIGLPSAAEFGLSAVYMLFITTALKPFGATEQAAFGIGQRLFQTAMMPTIAISFAATALAGQSYGAGLGARVRETFSMALKLGLSVSAVVCVLVQLIPGFLIGLFSDDPAVIAGGTEFLGILSLNLLAVSVAMACFGVLSGLGNTVPTLISSAVRIALVILPLTWLVNLPGFRPYWLWEMSVAASTVQAALNLFFLRREFNKRLGPVSVAQRIGQAD